MDEIHDNQAYLSWAHSQSCVNSLTAWPTKHSLRLTALDIAVLVTSVSTAGPQLTYHLDRYHRNVAAQLRVVGVLEEADIPGFVYFYDRRWFCWRLVELSFILCDACILKLFFDVFSSEIYQIKLEVQQFLALRDCWRTIERENGVSFSWVFREDF